MRVDLRKPTDADLEKIRAAMAGFTVTLRQFQPVVVKLMAEAGTQIAVLAATFRRTLEANVRQEERRGGR